MLGTTIAHYRILRKIGSGGMGVVYEAEDPRLGRNVALKILPHELISDPQRLGRFVREARAAAQLEHPNIGVVHEIGQADNTQYIVMELIRGETLSQLVARRCLSLGQVIALAIEIAEGLGRAHEKGILHRDHAPPIPVRGALDGSAKSNTTRRSFRRIQRYVQPT